MKKRATILTVTMLMVIVSNVIVKSHTIPKYAISFWRGGALVGKEEGYWQNYGFGSFYRLGCQYRFWVISYMPNYGRITVTKSEYERLEAGMTVEDVEDIVGGSITEFEMGSGRHKIILKGATLGFNNRKLTYKKYKKYNENILNINDIPKPRTYTFSLDVSYGQMWFNPINDHLEKMKISYLTFGIRMETIFNAKRWEGLYMFLGCGPRFLDDGLENRTLPAINLTAGGVKKIKNGLVFDLGIGLEYIMDNTLSPFGGLGFKYQF